MGELKMGIKKRLRNIPEGFGHQLINEEGNKCWKKNKNLPLHKKLETERLIRAREQEDFVKYTGED